MKNYKFKKKKNYLNFFDQVAELFVYSAVWGVYLNFHINCVNLNPYTGIFFVPSELFGMAHCNLHEPGSGPFRLNGFKIRLMHVFFVQKY